MRNLKKVLALVLALAMAFSLVASAATFPDVETNTTTGKAVGLLSGLGVIGGYPDGTFGPEKTITRAEFSKMLFIMINGSDNTDLYAGNSDKFSDVTSDKWFCSYVNWAVQLGIVGGYPDGTFKPDAPITIAEAAKMYVTALGFNALDFSFPFGFIDKAVQLGLFTDLSGVGANNPAKRSDIALMGYNALFVMGAPRFGTYNNTNGTWTYVTPIEKVFGAKKVETEVVATSTNMPSLADINKAGEIALVATNSKVGGVDVPFIAGTPGQPVSIAYASDIDALVGHKAEVWFTKEKGASGMGLGANKGDKILAINDSAEQAIVVSAQSLTSSSGKIGTDIKDRDVYTSIDGNNIMLFAAVRDMNGTPTIINGESKMHFWNNPTQLHTNWVMNGGAKDAAFNVFPRGYNQNYPAYTMSIAGSYSFIDNDLATNDRTKDAWDHVYVNYWRTGEVTSITSANIAIKGINNGASIPVKQVKGAIPDVKKGDFVNVTVTTGIVEDEIKDVYTIEKSTVLKETVMDNKTNRGFTAGGTTYLLGYFGSWFDASKPQDGSEIRASEALVTGITVGEKYDIVLDKNGFVYDFKPTAPALASYMLIKDVAVNSVGLSGTVYSVTGMLSDGTVKTFELDGKTAAAAAITVNTKKIFDKTAAANTGWTNAAGNGDATDTDIAAIGQLVTYTVNGDGKITAITTADNTKTVATNKYSFDKNQNVIYKNGTVLDAKVKASTLFFNYDNAGTPADYRDDKFTVTTGDKMNAFANTEFAVYTHVKDDTSTAEAICFTGTAGSVVGYNTKLAYYGYDAGIVADPNNKNMQAATIKLLTNGTNQFYTSNYYDVTNVDPAQNGVKAYIYTKIFGSWANKPANTSPCYIEFGANNEILSGAGKMKINTDITTLAANTCAGTNGVNVYRASVMSVDGQLVTFGRVGGTGGRAPLDTVTKTTDANGNITTTYNYAYNEADNATIPVAADANITVVDANPSSWPMAAAKIGTLADLQGSSSMGVSYVVDFVLRNKDNNPSNPLEISQMMYFKFAVSNQTTDKTTVNTNTDISSIAGDVVDPKTGKLPNVIGAAEYSHLTVAASKAKLLTTDVVPFVNGATVNFCDTNGNRDETLSTNGIDLIAGLAVTGKYGNGRVLISITSKDGSVTSPLFWLYVTRPNDTKVAATTIDLTIPKSELAAGKDVAANLTANTTWGTLGGAAKGFAVKASPVVAKAADNTAAGVGPDATIVGTTITAVDGAKTVTAGEIYNVVFKVMNDTANASSGVIEVTVKVTVGA